MELNELIPERVKWEPNVKFEGKPDYKLDLTFRIFTIEDEAWLKRTYPGGRLQEVFSKLETAEIARIAFHQLDIDSKRKLMEIKFKDMDEEGNEIEIATTGPQKVGALTNGPAEILELINMILKTRGMSLPLLEKIIEKVGIEGLEKMAHDQK